MIFQAHKGVSCEAPENTLSAIDLAIRQGYGTVELDVGVTADSRFVLLHDATINRTARLKGGEELDDKIYIKDITYEEALKYDFGIFFSKKYEGEKIPTLSDALKLAKKGGVRVKVDNKYQRFEPAQRLALFKLLAEYPDTAALTCNSVEAIKEALEYLPNARYHYDGEVNEQVLAELKDLFTKDKLTVWLPHENPSTTWVKVPFATPKLARAIKEHFTLGLWILSRGEHLKSAMALGADVIETNGQLKPRMNYGLIADMHTHSENSHDSVCKISDMRDAQAAHGTSIFAVTDHFDTYSHDSYDIFTPIKRAADEAVRLNAEGGDMPTVLRGIEISESFWFPDVYAKARGLAEFDVIIGSVHCVRYELNARAYSLIDFSKLSDVEIAEFLDAYFDDVKELISFCDFDILAHLTCPLRYIVGKYGREVRLEEYAEKIEDILKTIIRRGIALEVNTSTYDMLGEWMPPVWVLEKYHEMGGHLITLGSDAHTPERASAHFKKAINGLSKIGFSDIYYYKERKGYQIAIK